MNLKAGSGQKLRKQIKQIYYGILGISLRTLICLLIIGGMLLPIVYTARLFYLEGDSARAKVELYYEKISDAQYPDSSRFTYYDLVDLDHIEAALALMHEEGLYLNFTAEELQDSFFVYSSLDSAVRDAVEYARSGGADYNYVANEYSVVFNQPHDEEETDFIKRVFPSNNSQRFLTHLMEVDRQYFVRTIGGVGGFEMLADIGDSSIYDYGELVDIYSDRIDAIIDALDDLSDEVADGFLSVSHDRTVKDIEGEYRLLLNKLNSIDSFILSSGLTRDLEITRNKLTTNIETNRISLLKTGDAYTINKRAQDSYDHTFTENLIVVAQGKYTDSLYQVRPTTSFDTVVVQKNDGMENKAEYAAYLESYSKSLNQYTNTSFSNNEYDRLCLKCEELIDEFETAYGALTARAAEVVADAYAFTNQNFMRYTVKNRSLLTGDLIVNCGILFVIGVGCTFVLIVIINTIAENSKKKKRVKILTSLKQGDATKKKEV